MTENAENLTPRRRRILELLAEHKGLTTPLIARALGVERTTVHRDLAWLAAHGLIARAPMPGSPAGPPAQYSKLLRSGATAIGTPHGTQFYRRPTLAQLAQRALLLDLARQVAAAPGGWTLLAPERRLHHPAAGERTRQSQILLAAVQALETAALHTPAPAADPGWQRRAARLRSGALDGYVPRRVNEYLAYVDGDPTRVALLLIAPLCAGRGWWLRPAAGPHSQPGRLTLYRPLAPLLPGRIAAVFVDPATLTTYLHALHQAGILAGQVQGVAHLLERIVES